MGDKMSFWYLATPYTKYPDGLDAAFVMACEQAAILIKAGIDVYSPIAHWHPIAVHGGIDKTDHEFWMRVNAPALKSMRGIVVVQMQGWQQSKGIHHELNHSRGKPVVWMDVGVVPPELLPCST